MTEAERLTRAEEIAGNREAGASELLAQLLPLLAGAIEAGHSSTVAVARLVCRGQPVMAPLWNACAAAVAEHHTPGQFSRVRARMERAPAALVRAAGHWLRDACLDSPRPEVLTVSFSGSVLGVLRALGAVPLRVVCAEGRPRFEGRRMATALATRPETDVVLATDAAITTSLETATAVVVGADAIASDYWINKVGTRALVAAAWQAGIPVYVIATSDKAWAASLAAHVRIPTHPPAEVWAEPSAGVRVVNPYFESIPAELVTLFLTETGPVSPPDVAGLSERFANDISRLIKDFG